MENTAEYPALTSFRDFCRNVAKGMRKTVNTVNVTSDREMLALMDAATKMPAWFQSNYGIRAGFGGASSDVLKKGFTFKAADCTFSVLPATKAPQKKNVAITSIMAYKQLDDSEVALKIARTAIELTIQHGEVSDNLVARKSGEGANRVSARRNDTLQNPHGITVDGKAYFFKWTGIGKCLVTGFTVKKWAMLPTEPIQIKMF